MRKLFSSWWQISSTLQHAWHLALQNPTASQFTRITPTLHASSAYLSWIRYAFSYLMEVLLVSFLTYRSLRRKANHSIVTSTLSLGGYWSIQFSLIWLKRLLSVF